MKNAPLTNRQREVLETIRSEILQRGRPPTLREIGQRLAMHSTGSVRDHLHALVRKGYLTWERRRARGLQLTARFRDFPDVPAGQRIPVLGTIAAGQPILAEENYEGSIELGRILFAGDDVFALRVQGDSMKDAGILNGDYVFVRKDAAVNDGDIVAVLIDDEATVKRYFREKRRIRLQPENAALKPIHLRPAEAKVRILGKVVGSLRHY